MEANNQFVVNFLASFPKFTPRFLSFIEYQAIDNLDKPIYNVIVKDRPFSYTSNTLAQGMCVGNGTKEQEANKGTFIHPTNL